jgi:hypothetical protein
LLLKSLSEVIDKASNFVTLKASSSVFGCITLIDKIQIIGHNIIEFIQYSIIPLGTTFLIFLLIVFSIFALWVIITDIKSTKNSMSLMIKSVQKMDTVYIEYLFAYVIPFISLDYSSLVDIISLFIFLIIAGIIYINSDLLYVNIFFSIREYHLFKIVNEEQDEYIVLSKKKQLYVDKVIEVKDVSASSERFVLELNKEQNV